MLFVDAIVSECIRNRRQFICNAPLFHDQIFEPQKCDFRINIMTHKFALLMFRFQRTHSQLLQSAAQVTHLANLVESMVGRDLTYTELADALQEADAGGQELRLTYN